MRRLQTQSSRRLGALSGRGAEPHRCVCRKPYSSAQNLAGIQSGKLASKLGVKFQQLQKYERGRNRLSASRLWDVSRILRVDVNFFYEDMPLEIAKQSPRMMYGDCDEDKELDRAPFPGTKETSTEAQELLRMYFKISNREIAGQIFDLMHSLSKSPYHYNSEKQSDSQKTNDIQKIPEHPGIFNYVHNKTGVKKC